MHITNSHALHSLRSQVSSCASPPSLRSPTNILTILSPGFIIRDDPAAVGAYIGTYIAHRITEFTPTPSHPNFVLGLPTGSSPIPTYQHLIRLVKADKLSFKNVVTFNMDEYVGLPRDHPESYHSFMYVRLPGTMHSFHPPLPLCRFKQFFSHVDIPPRNVHILDGTVQDLISECAAYEQSIKDAGGVDLFLAGIGEDGHLAFNEPGESPRSFPDAFDDGRHVRVLPVIQDTHQDVGIRHDPCQLAVLWK